MKLIPWWGTLRFRSGCRWCGKRFTRTVCGWPYRFGPLFIANAFEEVCSKECNDDLVDSELGVAVVTKEVCDGDSNSLANQE